MTNDEGTTPDQVHVWRRCHACNAQPIVGAAFECQTCPDGPDNDLCERCYPALRVGRVAHPMPGSLVDLSGARTGEPHPFARRPGRPRLAYAHWHTVPDARSTAPPIPDHFVVRPELRAHQESFIGSYGFVIAGQPPLLLTCLHVLSSLIQATRIDTTAHNPSYSGQELPRAVTGANLYDVFAPHWMGALLGRATSMLALPDARTQEPEPASQRDIAAFVVDPAARVSPAPLAARVPAVGDPVWLAVKSEGGPPRRALPAVVVEHTATTFIFRFLDGALGIPRFASGAPLVDRAGEVVAINAGMGKLDGRVFGHGAHADSIRRHLRLAAPRG